MAPSSRLAKLSAPRIARVLARPRLFQSLDAAVARGAVWLAAPPGAGKTALVASWLDARKRRHAWVQLDEGDSDVAAFFHHLLLALHAVGPRRAQLPAFRPGHLHGPGAFARSFFRALSQLTVPTVIVLDDYHLIPSGSPVHEALRDGLGERPERVGVLVLSRTEPPAPLVRLQGRGQLQAIPADQLAVSEREARAIAELWGYSGRERDRVAALHARTEGWAAGLVLLLERPSHATERQGGSSEQVLFEYIGEEVFRTADDETQRLLLETSLLPRVAEPVASQVTGIPNAGDLLERLARRGYFVTRHDAAVRTYQYHALFREFLLGRAEKTLPAARRAELRLAAARVTEASGQVDDALGLYVQAAAWADTSRLVAARGPTLLRQGRAETLVRWALSVPEEARSADPWLLFWLGLGRSPFDPAAARVDLERSFALFRGAGDATGVYLAWSAIVETYLYDANDLAPLDHALELLEELSTRFPQELGPAAEAQLVNAAFGALSYRQPWNPALRRWEERALRIALAPGDASSRLTAGRTLSLYHGWWAMDLAKARLLMDALRPLATGRLSDPQTAATWCLSDANHHLHLARAGACLEAVDRGLAIAYASGAPRAAPFLLMLRCWASVMTGDLAVARSVLAQMATGEPGRPASRLGVCAYHYASCVVARHAGDDALAREAGRIAVELAVAAGMPLTEASCRLALALAEPAESVEAGLEEALALARRCGTRIVEAAALFGLTVARLRRRDEPGALDVLKEALAKARELGTLNFVWLLPGELSECCALALEHGIEADHALRLVSALRLPPGARARDLEAWPWDLRIEALGGFDISRNGERLRPRRKAQKKVLEALRLLVAHGPDGMRQDQLADALWPDAEGDAGHRALGTTIYRARKLLGNAAAIVQRAGRVALDPGVVFVDAWALERLAGEAAAARAGRNGRPLSQVQAQAMALHRRGELFGSECDELALSEARERLRRQVEACLRGA